MVNRTLDIEAIKQRADDLAKDEEISRDYVIMSGAKGWPLGDAIKASLADVPSLLAALDERDKRYAELSSMHSQMCGIAAERATRIEQLEADKTDPLRSALIGILRADGYQVTEPMPTHIDIGFALPDPKPPTFNPDAAASDMLGEDATDDYAEDSPKCGTFTGIDVGRRLDAKAIAAGVFSDAAPLDDGASEAAGTVCPKCKGALVTPGGACRYLDCARSDERTSAESQHPFEAGTSLRITAPGLWQGRFAIATGTLSEHGGRHCVQVCAKGVELANAVDVDHVYVISPDVDEPIAASGPIQPAKASRKRAEEPPKLVTEWAPDGRDFEGYAKDLGIVVNDAMVMVEDFKLASSKASPDKKQARWGGTFKDWAKARLANQA